MVSRWAIIALHSGNKEQQEVEMATFMAPKVVALALKSPPFLQVCALVAGV